MTAREMLKQLEDVAALVAIGLAGATLILLAILLERAS
jgi:hypothetical protein